MSRTCKKWTAEEEKRLLQQVSASPQNLTKCFLAVSESIGRTPQAVANHWYTVVSKKPNATCFFTASPKTVSRNRKNGEGVESTRSIWQRLMSILHNL